VYTTPQALALILQGELDVPPSDDSLGLALDDEIDELASDVDVGEDVGKGVSANDGVNVQQEEPPVGLSSAVTVVETKPPISSISKMIFM
jgi:hypothetical protein